MRIASQFYLTQSATDCNFVDSNKIECFRLLYLTNSSSILFNNHHFFFIIFLLPNLRNCIFIRVMVSLLSIFTVNVEHRI